MNNGELEREIPGDDLCSCEPALCRKEFLALVLKRATLAGVVLATPKVVDKFLIPPAKAMMVTTSTQFGTES
jgi:hypothetical protein